MDARFRHPMYCIRPFWGCKIDKFAMNASESSLESFCSLEKVITVLAQLSKMDSGMERFTSYTAEEYFPYPNV